MVFFTSDLHFGHAKVIDYCNRPFATVDEMDQAMITNWNAVVTNGDEVYILGDVTMKDQAFADCMLRRLNGHKYLVRGNHDYFAKNYTGHELAWVKDYHELRCNKRLFILCHYPFVEWNRSHHGSIHLHGHQHNHTDYNLRQRKEGRLRYDVGVDANNFTPVSLDKVVNFFN